MLYRKKRGTLNHGLRMERLIGELMYLCFRLGGGKDREVESFVKYHDNDEERVATLDDFKTVLGMNNGQ